MWSGSAEWQAIIGCARRISFRSLFPVSSSGLRTDEVVQWRPRVVFPVAADPFDCQTDCLLLRMVGEAVERGELKNGVGCAVVLSCRGHS